MSFWVSLNDENGDCVQVDSFEEGGTYALGGSTEADLNITYNYSRFYHENLDEEQGLRWLDGKTGQEAILMLQTAVSKLGTECSDNYWAATPGNAGYALSILLKWAQQYPQAVFRVS